jgi:preprotein translocase subunit SecG
MTALLTFIHVANCIALMIVVLLQAGRGAGMAGVFGASSAGQQIFGGRGASGFLGRLTAILAIVFMFTSIGLTLLGPAKGGGARSVVREAAREASMPTGGPASGTATPSGEVVPPSGGSPAQAPAGPAETPTGP